METFITFYFWLLAISTAIRIVLIGIDHYPQTRTFTLAAAVARTFISLLLTLWAGWLLWG